MSDKTKIEWTERTWNPLRGCIAVSPGCKNCYAAVMAARFSGPGLPYEGLARFDDKGRAHWIGRIALVDDKLREPLTWRKPAMVFVNSMSDLFHDDVPVEFIRQVFAVMGAAKQHTFQVLTKRADRMRAVVNGFCEEGDFADQFGNTGFPWPNVWLGVSVENRKHGLPRINHLRKTPAAVRFLSVEPLLGFLDAVDLSDIQWVIGGGESGHDARPMHPDWIRYIRDSCNSEGVPFFFKQWGEWVPVRQFDPPLRCPWGSRWGTLDMHGRWFPETTPWNGREGQDSETREYVMLAVGKGKAGRMLDGRTWDEMPMTGRA